LSTYTLKNGIFTTAAIDNIDHDPSSATEAFHDTNISIFQHPEEEHPELGLFLMKEARRLMFQ
jgi:hypothetical protein